MVIDPRTAGETPLGENPWRREDLEEDEYEEDEVCQPVEAKAEDVGIDKEWSAEETIPGIEGQAEPGQEEWLRKRHGFSHADPGLNKYGF